LVGLVLWVFNATFNNISVYKSRLRMGEKLAAKIQQEWSNEKIDVVDFITQCGECDTF
jgi:glutamine phosphoribosylpyrophosphate amidotransferase